MMKVLTYSLGCTEGSWLTMMTRQDPGRFSSLFRSYTVLQILSGHFPAPRREFYDHHPLDQ